MDITEKLKSLGIEIKDAPKPLAAYVPAVKQGKLVFTAGQLPFKDGVLVHKGKVGDNISQEDAVKAAEICLINCLSAIKSVTGNLDDIKRFIKVNVYVNASPEFTNHPQVANGASELLVSIFGEAGKHARAAIGVSSLPLGAPVEIDLIAELK